MSNNGQRVLKLFDVQHLCPRLLIGWTGCIKPFNWMKIWVEEEGNWVLLLCDERRRVIIIIREQDWTIEGEGWGSMRIIVIVCDGFTMRRIKNDLKERAQYGDTRFNLVHKLLMISLNQLTRMSLTREFIVILFYEQCWMKKNAVLTVNHNDISKQHSPSHFLFFVFPLIFPVNILVHQQIPVL